MQRDGERPSLTMLDNVIKVLLDSSVSKERVLDALADREDAIIANLESVEDAFKCAQWRIDTLNQLDKFKLLNDNNASELHKLCAVQSNRNYKIAEYKKELSIIRDIRGTLNASKA